jgi:hypothetical protein
MKIYTATLDECVLKEDGGTIDITKMKGVPNYKLTATYTVANIDASLYFVDKLTAALHAGGIPDCYTIFPGTDNCMVKEKTATLKTPTVATVKLMAETESGSLPNDEVEIGVTLREVETIKDADDKQIEVEYNGSKQTGTIRKRIPVVTAKVSRSTSGLSLDEAKAFVGTTSNGGPLGGSDGQWLTAGITNRKNENGTRTANYEFEYDDNQHKQTAAFHDENGDIPNGAKEGDGLKTVQVYKNTRFPIRNLNL